MKARRSPKSSLTPESIGIAVANSLSPFFVGIHRTLKDHSHKLDEHGHKLDLLGEMAVRQVEQTAAIVTILEKHGTILEKHSTILEKHGRILEGHGTKLENIDRKLDVVLAEAKKQGGLEARLSFVEKKLGIDRPGNGGS